MHIEFGAGDAGFHEARTLYRIVRQAQDSDPADSDEIQLLDTLRRSCESTFARAEYSALNSALRPTLEFVPAATDDGFWRNLLGPSRREILLSKQRIAALERAQRAERSSFEALAETTRVARERDQARERIKELEARLASSGTAP